MPTLPWPTSLLPVDKSSKMCFTDMDYTELLALFLAKSCRCRQRLAATATYLFRYCVARTHTEFRGTHTHDITSTSKLYTSKSKALGSLPRRGGFSLGRRERSQCVP